MAHTPGSPLRSSDPREIRLALVLNGGVSLAIWMGGVVAEIDRARRARLRWTAEPDAVTETYRRLLELTDSVLRTDVIAGASAGGLNGCLLAAAVANRASIAGLRDTWIEVGSFRRLLRSGWNVAPKSVLKGEEYFLRRLEETFEELCDPGAARSRRGPAGSDDAGAERVKLFVTTTELQGERVDHVDDFGDAIPDREHRALFVVEHDPGEADSPFCADGIADRLARIARSSASYPGAFEASLVEPSDDPVLAGIPSFESSRWVIDGGVLDNAPFGPALGAMARAPARGVVRRVLCYVTPHAEGEAPDVGQRSGGPGGDAHAPEQPTLRGVVGAGLNLPRSVTLTETLQDLEEYRRRADRRGTSRRAIAGLLDTLGPQAAGLVADYRRQREWSSAELVLDHCASPRAAAIMRESRRAASRPPPAVAEVLRTGILLPWIPPPGAELGALAAAGGAEWHWGLSPIERGAWIAIGLLARALAITPPAPGLEAARGVLFEQRERLSRVLTDVASLHALVLSEAAGGHTAQTPVDLADVSWMKGTPPTPEELGRLKDVGAREPLTQLARACLAYVRCVPARRCRKLMGEVVGALVEARPCVELVLRESTTLLTPSGAPPARVGWAALMEELDALVGSGDPEDCHRRLLQLEVIHEALAPSEREPDQRLDLMSITPEAACAWDDRHTPKEKLTGAKLANFAAFYKRSWRANDWLWGRLDGASRLVDVILDPEPLRLRLAADGSIEPTRRDILAIAAPHDDRDAGYLRARFEECEDAGLEARVSQELETLREWPLEGRPPPLRACRRAVRARLQLQILGQELDTVRDLARDDPAAEGAARGAAGRVWAERYAGADFTDPATRVEALTTLRLAEEESIGRELGSRLLTRNVATAAAVGASALSARHSGLGRTPRTLALALRGVLLALYALVWGATSSWVAVRLVAIGLVLGALAVIGWDLLAQVEPPPWGLDRPPRGLRVLAEPPALLGLLLGLLLFGRAAVALAVVFAVVVVGLVLWGAALAEIPARLFERIPVATAGVLVLLASLALGYLLGRWRSARD